MANLESAVEHLEDAVAIFNPRGELLFANPGDARAAAGRGARDARSNIWSAADHPLRGLSEQTLASRGSRGPVSATFPDSKRRIAASA